MEVSSDFESPVLDIIRHRRSRRAYSDRPIEPEKIKSLFEAARWAPSSMNDQPWAYIYAIKGQPLWQKIFDTLNESNRVWAQHAPLLIVSLSRKHFSRNGHHNESAKYDLGQANAFLSLQATSLDLNIHQMGGFDHQKAKVDLNVPESYELGVIMAIGYYGDPSNLSDTLRQREIAPRQRYIQDAFVMNKTF